jgi:hypothetical protein
MMAAAGVHCGDRWDGDLAGHFASIPDWRGFLRVRMGGRKKQS